MSALDPIRGCGSELRDRLCWHDFSLARKDGPVQRLGLFPFAHSSRRTLARRRQEPHSWNWIHPAAELARDTPSCEAAELDGYFVFLRSKPCWKGSGDFPRRRITPSFVGDERRVVFVVMSKARIGDLSGG